MVVSRWKVMLGVIGVSVGGLAAIAAQSDKPEPAQVELKAAAPAQLPVVPPPPAVAPASVTPAPLVPPISVTAPMLPPPVDLPDIGGKSSTPPTPPQIPSLSIPSTKPVAPAPSPKPTLYNPDPVPASKPATTVLPATTLPLSLPTPPVVRPASGFSKPVSITPVEPSLTPATPPVSVVAPEVKPTVAPPPSQATVKPTVAVAAASTSTAITPAQTKFRIVLRVGAGEPSFEVRHGDNLVMKVACEKVDIKSPEKGQGLSNITASGKVKFVGFGAEGTCDTLSFLAGTGEVSLAGNVNVKVRDKIGRVESELNADKMQYKLDQTALTGVLKP